MSVEVGAIRGVRNIYGTREKGYGVGVIKTEGVSNELTVDLSGSMLDDIANGKEVIATVKVPAGAILTAAYYETTEVFTLGGTTPAVEIGTDGSEVTNGVTVSEAQLESVGADDITAALAGTWAAGSALAAETTVGVALSGTSPTAVAGAGKARVTIVYKKVSG
jgi:hypothetical protein